MGTNNDKTPEEIYDEPFFTVPEAADELNLRQKQLYTLLAFDQETGRPGPNSEFPNAYKKLPHKNAEIRIPQSDIQAYKRRRVLGEPALAEKRNAGS